MAHVVIVGATSEIGGALALKLCQQGDEFTLLARREAFDELSTKLYDAGAARVHTKLVDAADLQALHDALAALGHVDHAVVCFGILGDQTRAERDALFAAEVAHIDYTAQIVALTALSATMQNNSTPSTLVAFSSIAGWRARRANYVYGSTKAGLDAFCQGLSDALYGSALQLIVARPGFVIGNMTKGMSPAPLSVTADVVAAAVATAIQRHVTKGPKAKATAITLWIPRQLQVLAWIMRLVPRWLWRKMPR